MGIKLSDMPIRKWVFGKDLLELRHLQGRRLAEFTRFPDSLTQMAPVPRKALYWAQISRFCTFLALMASGVNVLQNVISGSPMRGQEGCRFISFDGRPGIWPIYFAHLRLFSRVLICISNTPGEMLTTWRFLQCPNRYSNATEMLHANDHAISTNYLSRCPLLWPIDASSCFEPPPSSFISKSNKQSWSQLLRIQCRWSTHHTRFTCTRTSHTRNSTSNTSEKDTFLLVEWAVCACRFRERVK